MVEASRQIHGIRVFDKGDIKDAEAEEMQHAVEAAAAEVNGDTPPEPPPPTAMASPQPSVLELDYHVRIKGPVLLCTAEQKDAYIGDAYNTTLKSLGPFAFEASARPKLWASATERFAKGSRAESPTQNRP